MHARTHAPSPLQGNKLAFAADTKDNVNYRADLVQELALLKDE
jgi:hypothetical protein